MDADKEGIVHAIEFDRFTDGRIDHMGVTQNRGGMTSDPIDAIEDPGFLGRRIRGFDPLRRSQDGASQAGANEKRFLIPGHPAAKY